MTTDKPGSSTRVRRARSRCAWALVGLSAIAVVSSVSAPPAGAVAAPVASAAPQAPSTPRHDGGGRSSPNATAGQAEPGHLNMAMLAAFVGLGLAIGVPIAGRARLANERSIRRFRAELRDADVSDRCLEAIRVDRDQAFGREPPSPGATGS